MSFLVSNYIRTINVGFYFQNKFSITDPFSLFGYQPVRWKKPIWLPRAPSKLYVVTQRKKLPPDEAKEVLRLFQNFKCFMRLTVEHCTKESLKQEETGLLSVQKLEEEEEEHRRLMDCVRQENERMARLRKEKREKEEVELMERIMAFKTEQAERAKENRELALQRLQETKDLAASFIKPEDFERAIEDAINNPVDYNHAIDLEGRKYAGRLTQPHNVDLEKLERYEQIVEGLTNKF